MKRALVTGVTGQDGSFLAELLLKKNYMVYGLSRMRDESSLLHSTGRDANYMPSACVHITADLSNASKIDAIIQDVKPDEVYHLAAQNVVSYKAQDEDETIMSNIWGIKNLLNACRKYTPASKLFFAGSSEMFGHPESPIQNESTPFNPISIYGISKVTGYHLLKLYREQYGFFGACGILYNHESPRRGKNYVTRKITSHAAKIKQGKIDKLELGNLDVKRDWGCAQEFVYGMWLMLQHDEPLDLVFSSGTLHSVRDVCDIAFRYVGLDYRDWVVSVPEFYRKESRVLQGDAMLARQKISWQHTRDLQSIVEEMVEADLHLEKTS
jgi:GDPmannose 4,6-dehydratase